MEIIKLLLNNSDSLLISILGAFIYDKLKSHSNSSKSDLMKK